MNMDILFLAGGMLLVSLIQSWWKSTDEPKPERHIDYWDVSLVVITTVILLRLFNLI